MAQAEQDSTLMVLSELDSTVPERHMIDNDTAVVLEKQQLLV